MLSLEAAKKWRSCHDVQDLAQLFNLPDHISTVLKIRANKVNNQPFTSFLPERARGYLMQLRSALQHEDTSKIDWDSLIGQSHVQEDEDGDHRIRVYIHLLQNLPYETPDVESASAYLEEVQKVIPSSKFVKAKEDTKNMIRSPESSIRKSGATEKLGNVYSTKSLSTTESTIQLGMEAHMHQSWDQVG
jgi:hypothetical protein